VVVPSTKKAVPQIYDKVPLEALACIFFGWNKLQHSSEFRDILLNFSFLEPRSVHLIIFFIYGRLGDFDDFPSPKRHT